MNLHDLYYRYMPKWTTNNCPPRGWYNYAFYFLHPHQYIEHLWLEAKWFLQRGTRGYSDRDVWGWYYHMAEVNAAALRHLASKKMGHPIGMTLKGWRTRLLKMADGFQTILDMENDLTSHERLSHKEYRAFLRSQECRVARGLRVYVKHFQSLWD